ncbi:MAG: HD domain-containing protein [Myxococcota bacterium]
MAPNDDGARVSVEVSYGPRFASALTYAAELHRGQRRKGGGVPYIVHPLAVASVVGTYGGDEDQAIAALLHDAIEDCGVGAETIAARYGERVAGLVVAATDSDAHPRPPWRARKAAHIARVRRLDADAKLVVAADKLHNATSILRDLRRGREVWGWFSAPRDQVRWYYRAMAEALRDGWPHPLAAELSFAVAALHAD